MEVHKAFVDIKMWKGIGSEIEREIVSAKKKITVVVPWISPKYVEILKNKALEIGKDNVEVVIVEGEENYQAFKKHTPKHLDLPRFIFNSFITLLSLLGVILSLILFIKNYNLWFLFLFGLLSIPVFVFLK